MKTAGLSAILRGPSTQSSRTDLPERDDAFLVRSEPCQLPVNRARGRSVRRAHPVIVSYRQSRRASLLQQLSTVMDSEMDGHIDSSIRAESEGGPLERDSTAL